MEALESLTRVPAAGPEGGGVRPEQPFIVLGQEEYGEHHSSIMHCRWAQGQGPQGDADGGWPPREVWQAGQWGRMDAGGGKVRWGETELPLNCQRRAGQLPSGVLLRAVVRPVTLSAPSILTECKARGEVTPCSDGHDGLRSRDGGGAQSPETAHAQGGAMCILPTRALHPTTGASSSQADE